MSHRLCSPFVDGQDNVLLLARLLARGAVMLLNHIVEKPCEPEHRKKVLSVLHFLFSKETRLCVKSVMVKCGSVLSTFPYWEASSRRAPVNRESLSLVFCLQPGGMFWLFCLIGSCGTPPTRPLTSNSGLLTCDLGVTGLNPLTHTIHNHFF